MKFIPLLLLLVVAGCSSFTDATDVPSASVIQDGVAWDVQTFSIVGLPPVDTVTIYRKDNGDSSLKKHSSLKFIVSVPNAGTYAIHALYDDRSTPDSSYLWAGDGKIVVSELKHFVTDYNVRVYRATDSVTFSSILFTGHIQR
jgi:hypothetical protein